MEYKTLWVWQAPIVQGGQPRWSWAGKVRSDLAAYAVRGLEMAGRIVATTDSD